MPFDPEAVTSAGSGLVFVNYYDDSVSAAYRGAIIAAEHELQSHFTNPITIQIQFQLSPLGANAAAQNQFSLTSVSYTTLVNSLSSKAVTFDDHLAVNGLPATDPSGGVGWAITTPMARMFGLQPQTNALDLTVTLNSNLNWSFGQDAIGAIEHHRRKELAAARANGVSRRGSVGAAS
jgi:hypothetical protein